MGAGRIRAAVLKSSLSEGSSSDTPVESILYSGGSNELSSDKR